MTLTRTNTYYHDLYRNNIHSAADVAPPKHVQDHVIGIALLLGCQITYEPSRHGFPNYYWYSREGIHGVCSQYEAAEQWLKENHTEVIDAALKSYSCALTRD